MSVAMWNYHSVFGCIPSAKVDSSAKGYVPVFKASLPNYRGPICQSVFVHQVLCTGIQGIYALSRGGLSAKVGSVAKFGSSIQGIYDWFVGGSISQSRFICQVMCTGIQGKYHLSELKSLIVIWGVFWGCFEHVMGCRGGVEGVTSDMTVQC